MGDPCGGGRQITCKCGKCADCIKRAAVKKEKDKTRKTKRRANQEAGDKAEE